MECRKRGDCRAYYYDSQQCFTANHKHTSELVPASPDSSSIRSIWLHESHINKPGVASLATPSPDAQNGTNNADSQNTTSTTSTIATSTTTSTTTTTTTTLGYKGNNSDLEITTGCYKSVPIGLNTGNGAEGAMVCSSWCRSLRPLSYSLCAILFTHTVLCTMSWVEIRKCLIKLSHLGQRSLKICLIVLTLSLMKTFSLSTHHPKYNFTNWAGSVAQKVGGYRV